MSDDLPKTLKTYEALFVRLIDVYRKMGLEENVEDALTELKLLTAIVKAHHNYLLFKKGMWQARLKDSS